MDLDRTVSPGYQEQRVNLGSQELDFQDLQELKVQTDTDFCFSHVFWSLTLDLVFWCRSLHQL